MDQVSQISELIGPTTTRARLGAARGSRTSRAKVSMLVGATSRLILARELHQINEPTQ